LQQFLPNISAADERAFLVMNKDGDFAILKGRWNGFQRRQTGDKKHKVGKGKFNSLKWILKGTLRFAGCSQH
jgi:hypothetical protein